MRTTAVSIEGSVGAIVDDSRLDFAGVAIVRHDAPILVDGATRVPFSQANYVTTSAGPAVR